MHSHIFSGQHFHVVNLFLTVQHGEHHHVHSSLAVALVAEQDRNAQIIIRVIVGRVLPYRAAWQFGIVFHLVPLIIQHHQCLAAPEGFDGISDICPYTGDSYCESHE